MLTRTSNTGVGPCVTRRAAIGNHAHADAGVSIHADGGPADGRGFAILEPVADGINNAIVGPSAVLGADLRSAFAAGTGEPVSSYDGVNGIQPRDDLGGINLFDRPQGLHRMRQHAQRHGRRPGHVAGLAGQSSPGHRHRPDHLPAGPLDPGGSAPRGHCTAHTVSAVLRTASTARATNAASQARMTPTDVMDTVPPLITVVPILVIW